MNVYVLIKTNDDGYPSQYVVGACRHEATAVARVQQGDADDFVQVELDEDNGWAVRNCYVARLNLKSGQVRPQKKMLPILMAKRLNACIFRDKHATCAYAYSTVSPEHAK